jgi:SAM-dependent methyltransferase
MLLDDIAAYWDSRADGYSQSIHEELAGETGIFFEGILRQALPEGEGLSCLDMGCGPGFFTLLLGRLGHHVISADYSPEMLERTRRNCAEQGFEAQTMRADAQNLPFEDGRFDFVCSRNLVWNLEKPERAYSEWLRVLKPGGRLLVCDGNHYLYYYREDYRRAWEERLTHDTRGVDPTPINEIARGLPLSRQLRPEWDVETLTKLGLREIHVRRMEQPLTYNFVLSGVR